MSDQVTFAQAVMVCFQTPELMTEYRRLTGATIGKDDRSAIERLIDEAAGPRPLGIRVRPVLRVRPGRGLDARGGRPRRRARCLSPPLSRVGNP